MSGELLRGLFDAIDAKDTQAFGGFLTDDCVFRFGSAPPIAGRPEIEAAVTSFFESIAGLEHVLGKTMAEDETLVVEGEVTYRRHDGREVPLPFANILRLDGDRIGDYRIYTDLGPLYAD